MARRSRRAATELSEGTPASSCLPGSQERQIVLRPPESLRINPRNAHIHSKRQIRQIVNSIKAAGFIGAIAIDEDDMVLAGHGRLAAAKSLKMERVPTLKVTGLSEAHKRAFVVADNKITENAGWDRELLAVELGELAQLLPPLNWDLTLTGFEPAEIDALFGDKGTLPTPPPRSMQIRAVHYVCCDWRHIAELIAAGRIVYGAMLNLCVWAKTNVGQGSFYPSQHELIAVFRVGADDHQNNIALGRFERNRSNLWTYQGVNSFAAGRMELLAAYPTTKPVALVADAMRDCTTRGDVVLDPFLRSGTTILAAEKIGRRGYGLECDPRYVDCVIRRWEAYTKLEAVLDGDGRTFAEVKAERLNHYKENPQPEATAAASNDSGVPARAPACERGDGRDEGGDWVALCDLVAVTPTTGGAK